MKRFIHYFAAAAFALTLIASPSFAKKPTAKNRQVHQQKRIAHGARSGALTRPEVRGLEKSSARVHRSIVKDRHDSGVFTPKERVDAQRKLNRQSGAIYKQTHDDQKR